MASAQSMSMKALHLPAFVKSIKDLKASTVPFPKITPTTLLIRVTHVSPTHVDVLYAQGLHQNNRRHAKPPFILGTDFAGVVISSPSACNFKVGDNVFGSVPQAFAEYVAIDTSGGKQGIQLIPESWENEQACAVGASATISLGCFQHVGGIRPGMWVLVTGATGGLGIMATQIAKSRGARVIALVGSEKKARPLRRLGIEHCVDYRDKDWVTNVKRIADGEGVEVVYDAVGMVQLSLQACRHGGKVVIVGFAGRDGKMEEVKMNRILLKSASVLGYRFGEHSRRDPEAVQRLWDDFNGMVVAKSITPVVHPKPYQGIDEIPKAMLDLVEHRIWGRTVVKIAGNPSQHGAHATSKL